MSGRMQCAFEALLIDQHSAQLKQAGYAFTEEMRQGLIN